MADPFTYLNLLSGLDAAVTVGQSAATEVDQMSQNAAVSNMTLAFIPFPFLMLVSYTEQRRYSER